MACLTGTAVLQGLTGQVYDRFIKLRWANTRGRLLLTVRATQRRRINMQAHRAPPSPHSHFPSAPGALAYTSSSREQTERGGADVRIKQARGQARTGAEAAVAAVIRQE
ncbi:hypothetical protein CALCODRAFT_198441 [Calocera cornea HHB12733]|uniref:Uncharacterized protein n=1 Tax=Calocera cornea HHB12733 TaxID=1353952 RepID=A0A165HFF5_9BASI|nr:hypothetical protein CALCODRAFT_198441 [Calocera cornea HHB12733]